MSNIYLIADESYTILIAVKDANEKEAKNYFVKEIIEVDDEFIEYLTEFTYPSLFGNFYQDHIGPFYNMFNPEEFDERIEQMAMDDRKEYISSWIVKNTKEFFKDAPELGDEYLRQLRKSNEENKFAGDFSKEFIEKSAGIAIQNNFYYGKLNIIKLDLEHEPAQFIKK